MFYSTLVIIHPYVDKMLPRTAKGFTDYRFHLAVFTHPIFTTVPLTTEVQTII